MINAVRILAFGNSEQLLLGRGIDARNAVQLAPLCAYIRAGALGRCLLLGCNVVIDRPLPEYFLGGSATGRRFGSPGHGWNAPRTSSTFPGHRRSVCSMPSRARLACRPPRASMRKEPPLIGISPARR